MPAKRERLWDCPSCDSKRLKGRYKACPNCGQSRGSTPTYPDPNAQPITDDGLLELANAGPDWNCEHCGESNRGDANFCIECGAPKGSSPSNQVKEEFFGGQKPDNARVFPVQVTDTSAYAPLMPVSEQPSAPPTYVPNFVDEEPSPTITSEPTVNLRGCLKPLLILLVIAIVGFGIFKALQPYEVPVTVDQFTWSRNISIQEYQTYREEGWSIPYGGRYVSEHQAIHHYNQVPDGQECRDEEYTCGSRSYTCGERDLGNGFSEDVECSEDIMCEREVCTPKYRDEPVYQTEYVYDIDRWGHGRNVPTTGTNRDDPQPYWGEFSLNCANQLIIGCERENGRTETYTVVFIDSEGKTYNRNEEMSDWNLYETDQNYILIMNAFGIQNDPLRPEQNNE